MPISEKAIYFLDENANRNERDWFAAHKEHYRKLIDTEEIAAVEKVFSTADLFCSPELPGRSGILPPGSLTSAYFWTQAASDFFNRLIGEEAYTDSVPKENSRLSALWTVTRLLLRPKM